MAGMVSGCGFVLVLTCGVILYTILYYIPLYIIILYIYYIIILHILLYLILYYTLLLFSSLPLLFFYSYHSFPSSLLLSPLPSPPLLLSLLFLSFILYLSVLTYTYLYSSNIHSILVGTYIRLFILSDLPSSFPIFLIHSILVGRCDVFIYILFQSTI